MDFLNNKIMKGLMELLKLGFYGLFAYLDVPVDIFTILTWFIVLDTLFGTFAAWRLGKNVRFKLLMWGFSLKISILLLPLIIALLAKGLQMDFTLLVVIVIKILTVSEFYSCIGNIYAIKNKKELTKMDIISLILISFRKAAKKYIEKGLTKIEQAGDCEKDK